MNILKDFSKKDDKRRIITIGSFDGLHRAHRLLIEKTVETAKITGEVASAITFSYDFAKKNSQTAGLILPYSEKTAIFEQLGIEDLYNVPFTDEIMHTSAEEFVRDVLARNLGVTQLVLGDDARFGSDMVGVSEIGRICEKYEVKIHIVQEVRINSNRVSSSLIRRMLKDGVVGDELKQYLGRYYTITSNVVHGNNFGNKIGFPTANIEVDKELILPKNGVYYAECIIGDKKYNSALNIGCKPSVENSYFGIEAFILDFSGDIYGQEIKIIPKKFLRDEIKYDSIDKLTEQIDKDASQVRILANRNEIV